MVDQIDSTRDYSGNEEPELRHLRQLVVAAPPLTFKRFRRRARLIQGTRTLAETQVHGFWVVLDVVLKRLFRAMRSTLDETTVADSSSPRMGGRA